MSSAVTGTYLDRIIADVRARLDATSAARDLDVTPRAPVSLEAGIRAAAARGELAVIAEIKRRSPSVGAIDEAADPAVRAGVYARAGAAGISVLTEPDHFGGSIDDLVLARDAAPLTAVLRKDFIIDERQLHEAARAGADAVLLIAAALDDIELRDLADVARGLHLEVLLEVHDEQELDRALKTDVTLIGVNNRDLRSFEIDLDTSVRLAASLPPDRLLVAESGIGSVADAARLHDAGAQAVLVGELLMRAPDVAAAVRSLQGRAA